MDDCPNCGALKNWMEDIQRCMDCGYMGDTETARLRAAVADLAEALDLPPLFHKGGPWMAEDHDKWVEITGRGNVTTKGMCDHTRSVLAKHATLIAECRKTEREG